MNRKFFVTSLFLTLMFVSYISCDMSMKQKSNFKVQVDRFADIEILRYQVPGFDNLSLRQKKFVYFLSQASLSGRDIIYDQNYRYNLIIRRTIHNIIKNYNGDKKLDSWKQFVNYAKRVWFSNGIHHHYSTMKIIPAFEESYFEDLIYNSEGEFPLNPGESLEQFILRIIPIIFNPEIDSKRVNLDPDDDIISSSANNYYNAVSQDEVEKFYLEMKDPKDPTPIWYGLNSRLTKEKGKIFEKIWK